MKRMLCTLLALSLSLGCLAAPALAGEGRYRWKTSSLAPKDMGYAIYVRDILFPALYRATDNELVFKAYWGGVMGDDLQALKNIRIGRLQAAGMSGQGTFTACPEARVLGLPFLFRDYDEVDYVKSKMLGSFDKVLNQQGLYLLAWLDQGFDETYSSDRPLKGLADFSGERFATWFGPLEGVLLQKLGAVPSPIEPMEIPSAVRTGAANAVIAPSIWIVGTQLYTVVRYVNPLKLRYSPGFWVLSLKSFEELPVGYRKNISEVRLSMGYDFCIRARKELLKYQEAIIAYGVEKVQSSPADIREIRRRSTPIWYELAGELYPRELLEEVLVHLADYRARGPEPAAGPSAAAKPAKPAAPVEQGAREEVLAEGVAITLYEDTPEDVEQASGGSWSDDSRQVARVQSRLQALGWYRAGVDGILGPMTFRAVRAFQEQAGLVSSGIVDQALLDALIERLKLAQAKLAALGLYKAPVDGAPGRATYRAVRDFQEEKGLAVSGLLDPETLSALGIP